MTFIKGYTPWNKGIQGCVKVRYTKLCEYCSTEYAMIPAKRFRSRFCSTFCRAGFQGKKNIGEKNGSWKGGISDDNYKKRHGAKTKKFRKIVLERDGYKCTKCNSTDELEVDHIKSFALHPDIRFEPSNGRVLCRPCHKLTDTWGRHTK